MCSSPFPRRLLGLPNGKGEKRSNDVKSKQMVSRMVWLKIENRKLMSGIIQFKQV